MAVQAGQSEGAASVHFSCTGGSGSWTMTKAGALECIMQREAYVIPCQLSRVGPQRAKL